MKIENQITLEQCLRTPYINGILQLIELNKDGLTQKEIFKLLNKQGDKAIQEAITILKQKGLIKNNYNKGEPEPTEEIVLIEKLSPKHTIEIKKGKLKKRHALIIAQNPIEALFNKYIKMAKETEDPHAKKVLEDLKKEIVMLWTAQLNQFDFNKEYITLNFEEMKTHSEQFILNLTKQLNEKDQKKVIAIKKIINNLNNHLNISKERYEKEVIEKKELQQGLILLLRETITKQPSNYYFHSHIDYIVLILQRLLLEDIRKHDQRFYFYVQNKQNPNIDKRRIELIKQFAQHLNPNIIQNSLFQDLTERLVNLENSIYLEIYNQIMKDPEKTIEEKEKLDKETYNNFFKIKSS
jgi:hypothetical protein